jgi:hypothetical protein
MCDVKRTECHFSYVVERNWLFCRYCQRANSMRDANNWLFFADKWLSGHIWISSDRELPATHSLFYILSWSRLKYFYMDELYMILRYLHGITQELTVERRQKESIISYRFCTLRLYRCINGVSFCGPGILVTTNSTGTARKLDDGQKRVAEGVVGPSTVRVRIPSIPSAQDLYPLCPLSPPVTVTLTFVSFSINVPIAIVIILIQQSLICYKMSSRSLIYNFKPFSIAYHNNTEKDLVSHPASYSPDYTALTLEHG